MELINKSLKELNDLIKKKEVKPSEILEELLSRIKETEPKLNAYITVTEEKARKKAEIADRELEKLQPDEIPELFGIPLSIKDNINVENVRMTCASKILENFISPYDATVIKRLREKGAIFVGKNNLDEFAMGSSTETSYFGPTKNPWDLERVPGGSSGGSAAAVSARSAIASLGSDTGGSIRQPAALCGVVGLKPTYGRVSRYGLTAFASSLDQIGPITKTVEDAAYLMNIISGQDSKDATSARLPVPNFLENLNNEIKGLKAGLPKEYFVEGIEPEVKEKVLDVVRKLESLGVEIEEISLPNTKYAVETYYIIAPAEASSNLGRFDGVRYTYRAKNYENLIDMYCKTRAEGFGDEVKRRIMIGTYTLSAGYYDAYYLKAQKVRTLIYQGFEKAFEKVDFIVTPVSPTTAFRLGEKTSDPIKMYLSDIFTIAVNLAGLPAISIPCGFDSKNLPIGLQIIGKAFDEVTILNVANILEKEIALNTIPPV
ncbi:Glutamyl-tRNA(Gln) amidotransferase subunit A [Desulfurobacterium thermolithotrophum DSM 11699]|uniref:Glutamyl-tRNA(Gln) amidotransferase subunit A n=1 Tax=Desulfurobacterium thermolithotrophum (strain DSM 11699 / BSA) TaxID=868864 RepID=F0S2R8_DESTD|nr:Asp-tRNA(Asn)/Glu-tRNA(Gln) amidotransferase subunit GatA [Desulfurobacterium thermolithotrophum]ADY73140.1 Glutamyl-tRNA(Gln) amidotransferase subunit A [Desulfurobacterium thermolithotrophum DSM 11699]